MIQVALKYNQIPLDIPVKIEPFWKNIGYDTKKIWSEYQLINRLLYRSRNQHKASFSLQHLKEVTTALNLAYFKSRYIGKETWGKDRKIGNVVESKFCG